METLTAISIKKTGIITVSQDYLKQILNGDVIEGYHTFTSSNRGEEPQPCEVDYEVSQLLGNLVTINGCIKVDQMELTITFSGMKLSEGDVTLKYKIVFD